MSVFTKFLSRYAGEIASIGDVINTIVSVLPLGAAEKAKVTATVDRLDAAAESILASVAKVGEIGGGISEEEFAARLRAAETRIAGVTAKLSERIDAAEKRIADLETANAAKDTALAESESKIADLDGRVSELKTELATEKGRITKLQNATD